MDFKTNSNNGKPSFKETIHPVGILLGFKVLIGGLILADLAIHKASKKLKGKR